MQLVSRSGSLQTEKCDEFAERLIAEFVQSPDIPHCCAIIVIRIDVTRGPRDLFLVLRHLSQRTIIVWSTSR